MASTGCLPSRGKVASQLSRPVPGQTSPTATTYTQNRYNNNLCLNFRVSSNKYNQMITSNVTSHHQGLQRKLRANYRALSLQCTSYLCISLHHGASYPLHHIVWYRTLSLHYAHAMRVFDVRASSSPLGYPCAKFCFCCTPIAELARAENLDTQSLTQSLTQLI